MCECAEFDDGAMHVCEACAPDVKNLLRLEEWVYDMQRLGTSGTVHFGVRLDGSFWCQQIQLRGGRGAAAVSLEGAIERCLDEKWSDKTRPS